MAISLRAAGSWAASNATTQTVTLPAHQAGDMLIVRTIRKPFTNPDDTVISTAGWAPVAAGRANGATANGVGVGSMGFKAFYKVAESAAETNPVVTWGTTSAPGAAVGMSYQKGAGEVWATPAGDGGGDATARTAQTSTIATHVSVTSGDMVDFFRGQCDDSGALTVPTITQAGVTYAAVTESPAAALLDGTSNDIAADGGYRLATAGTSSAAAVVTGTSAASEQHGAWMTRLRVTASEDHSGTATLTGGGVVTSTSSKDASTSPVLTGGGALLATPEKGASLAATLTGSGVASLAVATDRVAAPTVTGGGVLTPVGTKATDVTVQATGGGTLAASVSKGGETFVAFTGGGTVGSSATTDRTIDFVGTGGGALAWTTTSDRSTTIALSASGSLTAEATAGREGFAVLSGAGLVETLHETQRSATLSFSGGGQILAEILTDRNGTSALTGGGSVAYEYEVEMSGGAEVELTGGGAVSASGEKTAAVEVSVSGGGLVAVAGASERSSEVALTGAGALSVVPAGTRGEAVTLTGGGSLGVTYSLVRVAMDDRGNILRIPAEEIAAWFYAVRGRASDVALLTGKAAEAYELGDVRWAKTLADASELLAANWSHVPEGLVNDLVQEAHVPGFRLQSR